MFLIRETEKGGAQFPYVLCINYGGEQFNIQVGVRGFDPKLYALGSAKPDEMVFKSVAELIETHRQVSLDLFRRDKTVGHVKLTSSPRKWEILFASNVYAIISPSEEHNTLTRSRCIFAIRLSVSAAASHTFWLCHTTINWSRRRSHGDRITRRNCAMRFQRLLWCIDEPQLRQYRLFKCLAQFSRRRL